MRERQAVILAAGRGSRLGAATRYKSKCRLEVGGLTLIEHHVRALRAVHVDRICIVTGHDERGVRSITSESCEFVTNPCYASTNSLYSLWRARDWVEGPFLLLNADVLAHPEIYQRVAESPGSALAYDSRSGGDAEHMKVDVRNGLLRSMSKKLPESAVSGENVGILRFDEDGAQALFHRASTLIESGHVRSWVAAAMDEVVRRHPIRCLDVADLDWIEIDFMEDWHEARRRTWPAIHASIANTLDLKAAG